MKRSYMRFILVLFCCSQTVLSIAQMKQLPGREAQSSVPSKHPSVQHVQAPTAEKQPSIKEKQPLKSPQKMKLNAGIITSKLAETKSFYTEILGFGVTFENDFYLLLHSPGKQAELSFLLPEHTSQQALFHKPFGGQGMYLTIEVEDVDQIYQELKKKKVEIKIDIRNEPWGDRHFAISDPNGIAIDIVRYTHPE